MVTPTGSTLWLDHFLTTPTRWSARGRPRWSPFRARPSALDTLLPLADDPVAHVRLVVSYRFGLMRNPAAQPTLRKLLADPDEQVRKFAARSLAKVEQRIVAHSSRQFRMLPVPGASHRV